MEIEEKLDSARSLLSGHKDAIVTGLVAFVMIVLGFCIFTEFIDRAGEGLTHKDIFYEISWFVSLVVGLLFSLVFPFSRLLKNRFSDGKYSRKLSEANWKQVLIFITTIFISVILIILLLDYFTSNGFRIIYAFLTGSEPTQSQVDSVIIRVSLVTTIGFALAATNEIRHQADVGD